MNRKALPPEPIAISDEFAQIPAGKIAAIITHLEMRARPARPPASAGGFALRHVQRPDLAWYRDLYRRVGEPWLWFSRLAMNERALRQLIHDPGVAVYALAHAGRDDGILELDSRRFPDVQISFLGVVPELIGHGAGRFLMSCAVEYAWARSPRRVTVHTCTLDHPRALQFYQRSGFVPYARSLEVADDPRLAGLLPRNVAPHTPIVET